MHLLPGFRFYPTDQELLAFYLQRKAEGQRFSHEVIPDVDLYAYDPWELPDLAPGATDNWFFFVSPNSKYPNGARPTRITKSGYWKATGKDKAVYDIRQGEQQLLGHKKTLVFYTGRTPTGNKTEWIMNEYKLSSQQGSTSTLQQPGRQTQNEQKEFTLCRIHRKITSTGVLDRIPQGIYYYDDDDMKSTKEGTFCYNRADSKNMSEDDSLADEHVGGAMDTHASNETASYSTEAEYTSAEGQNETSSRLSTVRPPMIHVQSRALSFNENVDLFPSSAAGSPLEKLLAEISSWFPRSPLSLWSPNGGNFWNKNLHL